MRKSIQLTRNQLDVLDAIVAEIVLFNTKQQMAATSDMYLENEQEEPKETPTH